MGILHFGCGSIDAGNVLKSDIGDALLQLSTVWCIDRDVLNLYLLPIHLEVTPLSYTHCIQIKR